jgi:predicted Zn-dependent protease
LAQSLEAQNKPEAADAYRKYLAVVPDDPGARSRLIHLLVKAQEYDGALAELDHANAGKPPSLDSLRMRADIQIEQNKLTDAIATLQQAVGLAPRDAQLIGGLGRIYLQKRDFPAAEKELKAALQLDPNNLVYWKDLSSTYYLAGNCPATLATLDVVAKSEPPGSGAWFIRALCYDKLHQFKPALEAYDKFLALEQGKTSDQVWQAQQRSKVLKHMLEGKR